MTEADLRGCEDEPIRVPGAVQPHGALVAVSEPGLAVVVASANAREVLGREAAGATLPDLLGDDVACAVSTRDLAELNPLRAVVGGRDVDLVAHRADGLLVVEVEPLTDAWRADEVWHRRLPMTLQRLQAASTLDDLTAVLAVQVRELTGFDRVMVYRFDDAWNGEVVAEDRRDDLEPFLGLRYPASDIPAQARALYVENWLRLIPDAGYVPVPLVPERLPGSGRPLDLSGAALRSVSPVHLEYLRNMGVVSSMSVSLLEQGRLWGLIACHHYAGPHRPSPTDRAVAEFLGRTASVLLPTKADAADAEQVLDVVDRSTRLVEALGRSPRAPVDALVGGDVTLLDLVPCGGAAVRLGGRLHLLGETPPAERLPDVVGGVLDSGEPATRVLADVVPDVDDVLPSASGVLAVPVDGSREGDFLAWFRPESVREVAWGGDPYRTKVVEDAHGPRLSPRRSFARWTETVRGTSQPWRAHEVAAAEHLGAHLSEVLRRRAEDESRAAAALQRTLLLEQLPAVPGVALAARYAPSANDVVGGDWYDLVLLASGRVSIVLGDVAGHGIGAAAITAQLRHALRAYLLTSTGPGAALARLNELAAFLLPDEMATAVVAELDPATGRLAVASAGHLPVLLLDADGARCIEEPRGPALGLNPAATYPEHVVELRSDDRLVLFSDGLVERRGTDLQDALDRLVTLGAGVPRDPDALLDALLDELAPPADDDVTLVAIGRS